MIVAGHRAIVGSPEQELEQGRGGAVKKTFDGLQKNVTVRDAHARWNGACVLGAVHSLFFSRLAPWDPSLLSASALPSIAFFIVGMLVFILHQICGPAIAAALPKEGALRTAGVRARVPSRLVAAVILLLERRRRRA